MVRAVGVEARLARRRALLRALAVRRPVLRSTAVPARVARRRALRSTAAPRRVVRTPGLLAALEYGRAAVGDGGAETGTAVGAGGAETGAVADAGGAETGAAGDRGPDETGGAGGAETGVTEAGGAETGVRRVRVVRSRDVQRRVAPPLVDSRAIRPAGVRIVERVRGSSSGASSSVGSCSTGSVSSLGEAAKGCWSDVGPLLGHRDDRCAGDRLVAVHRSRRRNRAVGRRRGRPPRAGGAPETGWAGGAETGSNASSVCRPAGVLVGHVEAGVGRRRRRLRVRCDRCRGEVEVAGRRVVVDRAGRLLVRSRLGLVGLGGLSGATTLPARGCPGRRPARERPPPALPRAAGVRSCAAYRGPAEAPGATSAAGGCGAPEPEPPGSGSAGVGSGRVAGGGGACQVGGGATDGRAPAVGASRSGEYGVRCRRRRGDRRGAAAPPGASGPGRPGGGRSVGCRPAGRRPDGGPGPAPRRAAGPPDGPWCRGRGNAAAGRDAPPDAGGGSASGRLSRCWRGIRALVGAGRVHRCGQVLQPQARGGWPRDGPVGGGRDRSGRHRPVPTGRGGETGAADTGSVPATAGGGARVPATPVVPARPGWPTPVGPKRVRRALATPVAPGRRGG